MSISMSNLPPRECDNRASESFSPAEESEMGFLPPDNARRTRGRSCPRVEKFFIKSLLRTRAKLRAKKARVAIICRIKCDFFSFFFIKKFQQVFNRFSFVSCLRVSFLARWKTIVRLVKRNINPP